MFRCLIAFGGNLDTSEQLFREALRRLQRRGVEPLRLSQTVRTSPVGAAAGSEFLNAAATLDCDLDPRALLAMLHEVEAEFGRVRTVHWGPRTLDLDLLLFGEQIMDFPELVVPHPALWYRKFVLDPAAEVAPDMRHPLLRRTVSELRDDLAVRPIRLGVCCDLESSAPFDSDSVIRAVSQGSEEVEWFRGDACGVDRAEYFATVVIRRGDPRARGFWQPRNTGARRIEILAESAASAIEQLRFLSTAMTGQQQQPIRPSDQKN